MVPVVASALCFALQRRIVIIPVATAIFRNTIPLLLFVATFTASNVIAASKLRFEVLLTYPSFSTSHQLLEAIVKRYEEVSTGMLGNDEGEIVKFR